MRPVAPHRRKHSDCSQVLNGTLIGRIDDTKPYAVNTRQKPDCLGILNADSFGNKFDARPVQQCDIIQHDYLDLCNTDYTNGINGTLPTTQHDSRINSKVPILQKQHNIFDILNTPKTGDIFGTKPAQQHVIMKRDRLNALSTNTGTISIGQHESGIVETKSIDQCKERKRNGVQILNIERIGSIYDLKTIEKNVEIQDLKSLVMLHEIEAESNQSRLQSTERVSKAIKTENVKLKNELRTKQSELSDLRKCIDEKTRCEQKMVEALKNKDAVLQIYSSTVLQMGEQKEKNIRHVRVMEYELNDKRNEIKTIKSEKKQLQTKIIQLENDIQILSNTITQADIKNGDLSAEINEMYTANKKLQNRIENVETEKKEIERKYLNSLKSQPIFENDYSLITNEANSSENEGQIDAMLAISEPSTSSAAKYKKVGIKPNEKVFVCECGKTYDKKRSFDKHMQRHKTKITCEICKKKFQQAHDLKRHMLHHTGLKQFKCDLCEKRFTQKCNLLQHLKVHLRQQN